jgi:hypothetical protein
LHNYNKKKSKKEKGENCIGERANRQSMSGGFFCAKTEGSFVTIMAFFTSAISILQTLVVALGAGLAVWGVINLLEGYGNDNPGAKSQGMKQLMAGGGVALIGTQLIPLLGSLFG